MLLDKLGKKKVQWAIVVACIAATVGLVVDDFVIISQNIAKPTKPYVTKESLTATYEGYANNIFRVSLTNNGTDGIAITRGSCSSGYCFLVSPAALSAGQSNVTVEFSGGPPSGSTVFNVTTGLGIRFHWKLMNGSVPL